MPVIIFSIFNAYFVPGTTSDFFSPNQILRRSRSLLKKFCFRNLNVALPLHHRYYYIGNVDDNGDNNGIGYA